jgi:hypothetical protein
LVEISWIAGLKFELGTDEGLSKVEVGLDSELVTEEVSVEVGEIPTISSWV